MSHKYKIEYLYDSTDCETCGCSFASGYIIYEDGVAIVSKIPVAACYDAEDYNQEDAIVDLFNHLGLSVEITNGESPDA